MRENHGWDEGAESTEVGLPYHPITLSLFCGQAIISKQLLG
jgi:hypothetical protein